MDGNEETNNAELLICENEKIKQELEKYATLADNANDALLIVDLAGNILEANTAATKMYGYSPQELININILDLRREKHRKTMLDQFEKADREGIVLETVHYRKDGTAVHVEVSSKGMLIGGNRVILSIVRDITERKHLEKAMWESEARFKAAFMTGPDAFFWAALPEGKIIEVNESFLTLFGYSREEVIGKTSLELNLYLEPSDRARMLGELKLKGSISSMELRGRKKDGTQIYTLLSMSKVDQSGQLFTLGVLKDITERKTAEEELRNREIKYRTLFNTAEGAVLLFCDGRWVDCNDQALIVFGCSREQIIGQDPSRFSPPKQPDGLSSQEAVRRINLAYANEPQNYEWVHCRADGTPFFAEVSLKRMDLGDKPYIQAIVKDVTQQKAANDGLEQMLTLNNAIVEGTSDFIWSVDSEHFGLLTFNQSLSNYFLTMGVTICVGMRPEDMFPSAGFRDQWHALYHRALSEGTYCTEYTRADGNAQLLLTFGILKRQGKAYGVSVFGKDITERLIADEKLKLISERLLLATKVAKLGIWDWDVVNNELIWDDGMYHLYNIKRDDFANAYQAWSKNIHPEDRAATERAIQDALSGKHEYAPEFRIVWPDGSIHFLQASASTFRDSNGKPTRMVGINYDITDLRTAEAALRENEIRFRAFVEQSPIAIGIFSLEGIGLYANQKFIETLGLNGLDAFIGRPAYTYFAPQFAQESKERTRRRLQGLLVPSEYESVALHPDGSEFPVSLAIAPIHLPSGIVSIAILSDITDRKKAEADVRLEAEQYNALIESTSDWVWVVEPENYSVTIFNTAVADYFKRNHGIILKKGIHPEDMLSKNRIDQWKGFYNKAIRDGRFTIDYQTNAENLHFKVSLTTLTVENKTVGISVYAKDLTAEDQYKKQIEASNQTLSSRLLQTINAISKIGELRDVYTAGHQRKAAKLACAIALELGLSDEAMNNISFGALIHDIGKINIASDILNKPGKISSLEYQILQTHAEQSYEIIKEIDFPSQVKTMIYQHHERLDGSGYPQKLIGDQIILESRILAVADVVEAMTSHRPYRPALGIDVALEEIQSHKGIKYDADVVDACIKLFREKMFEF